MSIHIMSPQNIIIYLLTVIILTSIFSVYDNVRFALPARGRAILRQIINNIKDYKISSCFVIPGAKTDY